ncbi:hypothetical protein AJ80_06575 [Polytolypa hystricis UAMH7299]|uniref:Uncharacterized protein n=1 Tax=Polytolypa hystricis (strain UAMH7299) TaxID=1447883 RepID=A0A2B7XUH6_POLH7|nr:hypothetical protein AJ80_06575 [Polytolypa hystricis UAMH7299]
MDAVASQINALDIQEERKELIITAISQGDKISADRVFRIWRICDGLSIPGLEQRIHAHEFLKLGISEKQLAELTEVATTVGYQDDKPRKSLSRPIFALSFYGKLLAVAITVASNGFVVGMNRSSLDKFCKRTGVNVEELADLASWPDVKK